MKKWLRHTRALERVTNERDRQDELKAAGRFPYELADPELTLSQKLGKLTEELGEVARVVQQLEGTVADYEPGTEGLMMGKLRDEVTQVAALAVAWLEGLESGNG